MIRLYDAARCPYCARVRIVLAEKGLEYETVEIDLGERPAWLYEKNRTGRVPVLEEDGGYVLPESTVIMEYLESLYPEPQLLPADSRSRALVRLRVWRFDELGSPYYALRRGESGARERLEERLQELDSELAVAPFLGGPDYGLADIAYLPWILRARANLAVELERFPRLEAWSERLCKREAVAAEVALVAALAR